MFSAAKKKGDKLDAWMVPDLWRTLLFSGRFGMSPELEGLWSLRRSAHSRPGRRIGW
jgi:hypothetical protein